MKDAAVVLAFQDGKVLAVTRPDGGWALPGGGIEMGESPLAAAVREMCEETGLVPTAILPLGCELTEHGRPLWAFFGAGLFGELRGSEEGAAAFVAVERVLEGPYGQLAARLIFRAQMHVLNRSGRTQAHVMSA